MGAGRCQVNTDNIGDCPIEINLRVSVEQEEGRHEWSWHNTSCCHYWSQREGTLLFPMDQPKVVDGKDRWSPPTRSFHHIQKSCSFAISERWQQPGPHGSDVEKLSCLVRESLMRNPNNQLQKNYIGRVQSLTETSRGRGREGPSFRQREYWRAWTGHNNRSSST